MNPIQYSNLCMDIWGPSWKIYSTLWTFILYTHFFSWQVLLNWSLVICYGKQHDAPFDKWHILIFMLKKSALFQWMLPGPKPVSHPFWYIASETSTRFIIASFSWTLYHPTNRPWNRPPHNYFKNSWLS